jgi:hypothetical protein
VFPRLRGESGSVRALSRPVAIDADRVITIDGEIE